MFDYPDDVARMVQVLARVRVNITPDDAEMIWQRYSDDMCAGWICPPDNDSDLAQMLLLQIARIWASHF